MPPSRREIADRTFACEAGVRPLSEQDLREALTESPGVVADSPGRAEASFQAARLLPRTLRFKDSIAWFRRSAARQPDAEQVWQGQAEAVVLSCSDADRRDLVAALKSAPVDPKVRARLQDRFGSLRKVSRPRSGGVSSNVIAGLAAALRSGGAPVVETKAAARMRKAPRSAVVACILAETRAVQNRCEEAIASYRSAIRPDPDYAESCGGVCRLRARSVLQVRQPLRERR